MGSSQSAYICPCLPQLMHLVPNGANLISMSQLTNSGATFRCNDKELIVEDKNGKQMFRAESTNMHKGLYVMGGEAFRRACKTISQSMEAYFSDFEDAFGTRQHYVLT